jgi:three-Cys-motif partner protein
MAMPANVQLRLFFNDYDGQSVASLRANIAEYLDDSRYSVIIRQMDFFDAFASELPMVQCDESANLVILDQFGYRFINSQIFHQLVTCRTTDIIFFISSANIKRFIEEDATRLYFPIPKEKIESISPNDIHRFICTECIQSWIPNGVEYHVAPFSIKKDNSGNIYGLIFGSGSLLGLEKFLRVCWNKDNVTGEANFNIDNEAFRYGQLSLIDEDNVIKKQDRFRHDVISLLGTHRLTNRDLYRFCLESGFLPKRMNEILRELQAANILKVTPVDAGHKIKDGTFYISWNEYKSGKPRAYFVYQGG